MASNNLDIDSQRAVGRARQKIIKIEAFTSQVKKMLKDNAHDEERLRRMTERKKGLENDLSRMMDVTREGNNFFSQKMLAELDAPMDSEMATSEKFRSKMSSLRMLVNQLVVLTSLNERALCTEISHQEAEFSSRVSDAVRARNLLSAANLEAQNNVEKMMEERAKLWEAINVLENNLEICDCSTWLCTVENARISDTINKKSNEPKVFECEKKFSEQKSKEPPPTCEAEEKDRADKLKECEERRMLSKELAMKNDKNNGKGDKKDKKKKKERKNEKKEEMIEKSEQKPKVEPPRNKSNPHGNFHTQSALQYRDVPSVQKPNKPVTPKQKSPSSQSSSGTSFVTSSAIPSAVSPVVPLAVSPAIPSAVSPANVDVKGDKKNKVPLIQNFPTSPAVTSDPQMSPTPIPSTLISSKAAVSIVKKKDKHRKPPLSKIGKMETSNLKFGSPMILTTEVEIEEDKRKRAGEDELSDSSKDSYDSSNSEWPSSESDVPKVTLPKNTWRPANVEKKTSMETGWKKTSSMKTSSMKTSSKKTTETTKMGPMNNEQVSIGRLPVDLMDIIRKALYEELNISN